MVEKRRGELEKSEGGEAGSCERRRVAEAKDFLIDLDGEGGKKMGERRRDHVGG